MSERISLTKMTKREKAFFLIGAWIGDDDPQKPPITNLGRSIDLSETDIADVFAEAQLLTVEGTFNSYLQNEEKGN